MQRPVRGVVYTLEQVYKLQLQDMPHLFIPEVGVIQDSHIESPDQLLAVPHMKDTLWKYIRTTDEWIPIFHCENPEVAMLAVDVEPSTSPYSEGNWVTPKGLPRKQYEALIEQNNEGNDNDE